MCSQNHILIKAGDQACKLLAWHGEWFLLRFLLKMELGLGYGGRNRIPSIAFVDGAGTTPIPIK